MCFLDGTDAGGLSHAELEQRLDRDGRELLRRLLDDHLALRAIREQRPEQVIGDEGLVRGRVESGHKRALETVFGTVTVERLAYRAPGLANLHPADAGLNLPVERHSHGLRKLAAAQAARGSFQDAVEAIERSTGQQLGRRQVQELAQLAAVDFEDFYEARRPKRSKAGQLLVLAAARQGDRDAPRRAASQGRHPSRPGWPEAQNPAIGRREARPQADGGDRRRVRRHARAAHGGRHPRPRPAGRRRARTGTGRGQQVADRQHRQSPRHRDRPRLRRSAAARPQTPPHLARARRRRQPPNPTHQIRGQETQRQADDHLRLRARPRIPLERRRLLLPRSGTPPPKPGSTNKPPACSKDTPRTSPARSAAKPPPPNSTPQPANPPTTPPPTSPTKPPTSTTPPP